MVQIDLCLDRSICMIYRSNCKSYTLITMIHLYHLQIELSFSQIDLLGHVHVTDRSVSDAISQIELRFIQIDLLLLTHFAHGTQLTQIELQNE